jgi:hypothetical protein
VAGLSALGATTFVGIGCSVLGEPNLAIGWFAAATLLAGIGIVAWEEGGLLPAVERWPIIVLVAAALLFGFYEACSYVVRKTEEAAMSSMLSYARESKSLTSRTQQAPIAQGKAEPKAKRKPLTPSPNIGSICREDSLRDCTVAEIYQRVINLTNNIQELIDDIDDHNKSRLKVINAAQLRGDPNLDHIRSQEDNAYGDFFEIDMNKYRESYKDAVSRYKNELIARLGQRQTDYFFDNPKHVNHLRDVVRYLRGLADELKSKN